jgi:hypothetical protein
MSTVIGLVVAAVALLLIVGWHARTFAYRCRNCGDEFAISPLKDFWSPHGWWFDGGWKLLGCPRCHRWTRASVIRKSAMSTPDDDQMGRSP